MAPTEPASDASSAQILSLPEIIFSCGVCQASVSEIYASPESNKGFHSGSSDDDGVVTRLWIAECSHVTCGKHLAGGAAPFHPQGKQPQTPCPQCAREGDDRPKKLYGIRGLDEGEHDQAIPSAWFRCPPITLDGTAPGMEAVRFQFMALARYSQKIHARWKTAEEKRETATQVISRERKLRKQLQAQLDDAKAQASHQAAALKQSEAYLKKWEERTPIINRLMTAVKPMADDLRQMRSQLLDLGFDVPSRSYGFEDGQSGSQGEASSMKTGLHRERTRHQSVTFSSSSNKRKRNDHNYSSPNCPHQTRRMSSRDLMPPPPAQRPRCHGIQSYADANTLSTPRASQMYGLHDRVHRSPDQYQETQHVTSHANGPHLLHGEQSHDATTPFAPYEHTAFDQPYENDMPYSRQGLALDVSDTLVDARQYHDSVEQVSQPVFYQLPIRQHFQAGPASSQREVGRHYEAPSSSRNLLGQQQQGSNSMSRPLRPIPSRQSGPSHTPMEFSHPGPSLKEVKPPIRTDQTTTGSISSPFFQRRADASRFIPASRPPTRGSNVSKTGELYGQQLRNSYSRDHVTGDAVGYRFQSQNFARSQDPTSFRVQGRSHLESTLPFRGNLHQERINRTKGHSFQEPHGKQDHFTSPRGRITLPPPSSGTHNDDISSICGFRGGFPQRSENFLSQHNTSYNDSRPLLSAVSRRSVRR